jgi:hypothetical protein
MVAPFLLQVCEVVPRVKGQGFPLICGTGFTQSAESEGQLYLLPETKEQDIVLPSAHFTVALVTLTPEGAINSISFSLTVQPVRPHLIEEGEEGGLTGAVGLAGGLTGAVGLAGGLTGAVGLAGG